jgi:Ctr copper transporter family
MAVWWYSRACGIAVAATKWPPPLEPARGDSTVQQNANVVKDHALTTTTTTAISEHERAILGLDASMAEEKDDFEGMDQQEHIDGDSQSHEAVDVASNGNISFCQNDGMNMAMYMDGWHWSTASPSLDCLSYLVPLWRLETRWKFHGALLYTFGLAVLLSAVSSVRVGVVVAMSTSTLITQDTRPPPLPHHGTNHSSAQLLLLLFLYAVQALLGYALMLVVMTYSIELLLAAIAGLVTGHVVWAAARSEHDTDYSDDDEDVDVPHDGVHVERQSLLGPAGDFDGSVEGTLGTAGGPLLYRRR